MCARLFGDYIGVTWKCFVIFSKETLFENKQKRRKNFVLFTHETESAWSDEKNKVIEEYLRLMIIEKCQKSLSNWKIIKNLSFIFMLY